MSNIFCYDFSNVVMKHLQKISMKWMLIVFSLIIDFIVQNGIVALK